MANKFEKPVSADGTTTGAAVFYPQGSKSWTIRAVTNDPSTKTFNYAYKIAGETGMTHAQAFQLKAGTGVGDVILTNNDGDGGSLVCEKIFVTWASLSGSGTITITGNFED